jgi:hypothetical protein
MFGAATALKVERGFPRTKMMRVDTSEPTISAYGSTSQAIERLDLVARVVPKDFSPFAFGSLLQLEGSFAARQWHVERGPPVRHVVPEGLLVLANPLLALIPAADDATRAERDIAKRETASCRAAIARGLQSAR